MNKNKIKFIISLIVLISISYACSDFQPPKNYSQEKKDQEVKAFNDYVNKELDSLEIGNLKIGSQVAIEVALSFGESGIQLRNYLNENIKKYPNCKIVSIVTGKTGHMGSINSYIVVWEKIK